jgi:ATP-binding protein involved in chromosome partitioning
VIVTTPQPVAQTVARRSAEMAAKLSLEIVGVIENMAGFTTPDGVPFPIFGEGGGRLLAEELEVPLLGQIPLTMALRQHADSGLPVVFSVPEDPAAQAVTRAAARLIALDGIPLPMAAEPEPIKPLGMSLPMA